MSTQESITGTFASFRWRSFDNDYMIGVLEDKRSIKGPYKDGDLIPGLHYEFFGTNEQSEQYGDTFKFTCYTVKVPHSRHGIIEYLARYAVGVGPVVAARIWDEFKHDAVKMLRTDPAAVVAAIPDMAAWFNLEKAEAASHDLTAMADLEDTKIGLTNLFAGRGFPHALIEDCVKKWKILAPERIRRDPFCLLVCGFSGCGFSRCDKLYLDLSLPPDRLKRQAICLWHTLNSDSSGNTWVKADVAVDRLKQLVASAKIRAKKAIQLGCRSGWLAKHRDADGVLWLAEGERAADEAYVAEKIKELMAWQPADTTELKALVAMNEELACA